MKQVIEAVYVPETVIQDSVFNNSTMLGDQSVYTNEYNNPSVKTWIYTNVPDTKIWVDMKGLPLTVTYTNKVFNNTNKTKGVYIIRSFRIDKTQVENLWGLQRILNNEFTRLSEDDKHKILEYVQHISDPSSNRTHMTIRLVSLIPLTKLQEEDNISVDGYTFSMDIDKLYNTDIEESDGFGSISGELDKFHSKYIELDFFTTDGRDIELCIGDRVVNMLSSPYAITESVTIKVNDGFRLRNAGSMTLERFREEGLVTGTTPISDLVKRDATVQKSMMDLSSNLIKSKTEIRKQLLDVATSIHKLNAHMLAQKTAEVKLDKENTTAFREILKVATSLIS